MDLLKVCERYPEEVKRLVEKEGIDVNAKDSSNGTLLHYASWMQPSLVDYLIQKGANVNAATRNGNTPLHWASLDQVTETLLKHGADVNAKTTSENTALHWTQSPNMTKILLKYGADIHAFNNQGYTPLHWAETRDVIEILLEHGADIHALKYGGVTPLEYSCRVRKSEAIRTLYEHGSRLPSERYKDLDEIIALFAGMFWKRSRVGGLSSHILVSYLL
jgi:ankyrin repeat protein